MKEKRPPPRPMTEGGQGGGNFSQQADATDVNAQVSAMDRRRQFAMRIRSDSTGSTRGAFGQIPNNASLQHPPPITQVTVGGHGHGNAHRHGHSHSNAKKKGKKSKAQNVQENNNMNNNMNNMGLEQVAALALASVEDEESGFHPSKDNSNSRHKQTAVLNHTPLPPHPNASDAHDESHVNNYLPDAMSPQRNKNHLASNHRNNSYSNYQNSNLIGSDSVNPSFSSMPLDRSNPNFMSSDRESGLMGSEIIDSHMDASNSDFNRSSSTNGPTAKGYTNYQHPHAPPLPSSTPNGYPQMQMNYSYQHHQQQHYQYNSNQRDGNQDISQFSSMARSDYGTQPPPRANPNLPPYSQNVTQYDPKFYQNGGYRTGSVQSVASTSSNYSKDFDSGNVLSSNDDYDNTLMGTVTAYVDWTIHSLFYDPQNPEFTSLQQNSWAVVLGVFMGIFTAKWGEAIEYCVDVVWEKIPEQLLEWGVFTELDGAFPLPHYMWVCPAVFGGILSYICASLPTPIPGQNEWIESLHRVGIMDHSTFIQLILISTAGMASGLSLGPELPLVLSAGMIGSFLGLHTKQSILSARVMNLTAAAAAIGGFFGFPMAGALFVLEIPHQMGLQYFEALSPSIIASIFAVLVNRMVTGNEVKGYFNYPFLTSTLPSHIFYVAIIYGIVGSVTGIIYTEGCLFLKKWVHDWFHMPHDDHHDHHEVNGHDAHHDASEKLPLVGDSKVKMEVSKKTLLQRWGDSVNASFNALSHKIGIEHEPTRAAVAGVLAGIVVGLVCMFVPHSLFWGEAQLQTLIDKGRTPLPVFGKDDEPTAILTAYGYCLIDPDDEEAIENGFSLLCSGVITVTKIFVIGLSLGTGIVGGHFWGPLYVGCSASNFFTDLVKALDNKFGLGLEVLSAYPCVAVLCIMGSTHIVTFRAHMAIMLILTLTISAFTPENGADLLNNGGGDYSAVFPLLVVACFIPLMFTRSTVFYKQQRCRGDIIATPEVLCEPRKEGTPEYPMNYDDNVSGSYDDDYSSYDEDSESYDSLERESNPDLVLKKRLVQTNISPADIEREFEAATATTASQSMTIIESPLSKNASGLTTQSERFNTERSGDTEHSESPRVIAKKTHRRIKSGSDALSTGAYSMNSNAASVQSKGTKNSSKRKSSKSGRRSRENSIENQSRQNSVRERADSGSRPGTPSSERLSRVNSFGELQEFQPSLMHQARQRASSVTRTPTNNVPANPKGRHSRKNSGVSDPVGMFGGLTPEDTERAYSSVTNQNTLGK